MPGYGQKEKRQGRGEYFTISELAGELEITPRAIRFYEEKGLLSPRRSGATTAYTAIATGRALQAEGTLVVSQFDAR